MAFQQTVYRVTVDFMDNSASIVTRRYEAPQSAFADFDAFATAAALLITAVTAMTQAEIAGYTYSIVYMEDTLVVPSSGVENENQAIISAKIDGAPNKSGTLTVPAAAPGIFVAASGAGANVVDTADAAVAAFLSLFDGTPGWTVSDGEFIDVATASGRRRHVRSSNG